MVVSGGGGGFFGAPSISASSPFLFLSISNHNIYINIYTGREVDYKETNQNEAYQLKRERERES